MIVQPVAHTPPPPPKPPQPPAKQPEKGSQPKKATAAPAPAQVIVQLPEQAELFIDGQRSRLHAATRTVVTPELEPGESYYYTLRAELSRNGKKLHQERQVLLRAGEVARVDFRDLAPPAGTVADNAR